MVNPQRKSLRSATGAVTLRNRDKLQVFSQLLAELHGAIQILGAAASPAAAGAGDVPSPLAGKVVSLDVAAGASVKAGDQILTLEAMKMNTIIYAPASGTLTAFCVNPGDTVQEGQALAKIG